MENNVEIDEIKSLWAQSNRRLEQSMRLNTLLLEQWNLREFGTFLTRFRREVGRELAINIGGVVLLGFFASQHLREPQFLIPTGAIYVYGIALIVAAARQLAACSAIDYDEPVATIQMRLERLRIARIKSTLWTLLFAPLMWLPLFIVGARGVFGWNVYAAGPAWIAGNLLFGLAVIPLGVFVAKRYGTRLSHSAAMRRMADEIAGRSLTKALESLDSIRRFELN
ncbi:MAG: hypothetical protein JOZ77_11540 [Candidatus Eremiobacteraeota bacterium]|nr:hypothetical protein [Candidatus Eremiobacteraeota bacterium]